MVTKNRSNSGDRPQCDSPQRAGQNTIAVIDLGDFSCQPSARYGHEPYAMRSLSGLRVFERMVQRAATCDRISQIYLVGSNVPSHLIERCPAGVKVCILPSAHLVQRLAYAVDAADAQWCVYLPANRPFIDPALIDQLLSQTNDTDCDFIGFKSDLGMEHPLMLGLFGEIFHGDAIRRMRRLSSQLPPMQDQCIVSNLQEAPGAFHLKFVPLPSSLDHDGLRFSIQDDRDWDEAQSICKMLETNDFGWQELLAAHRVG